MQAHHGGQHTPAQRQEYRRKREQIEDENRQIEIDLQEEENAIDDANKADEWQRQQED